MAEQSMQIGLVLFPRLTQLDLTGPFEVFARIPDAKVHVVWKSIEPVVSDTGLSILPTTTFDACPELDVLCAPAAPASTPCSRTSRSWPSSAGKASGRAMSRPSAAAR